MNETLHTLNELNKNLLSLLQQSEDADGHYAAVLIEQALVNTLNMKKILEGGEEA